MLRFGKKRLCVYFFVALCITNMLYLYLPSIPYVKWNVEGPRKFSSSEPLSFVTLTNDVSFSSAMNLVGSLQKYNGESRIFVVGQELDRPKELMIRNLVGVTFIDASLLLEDVFLEREALFGIEVAEEESVTVSEVSKFHTFTEHSKRFTRGEWAPLIISWLLRYEENVVYLPPEAFCVGTVLSIEDRVKEDGSFLGTFMHVDKGESCIPAVEGYSSASSEAVLTILRPAAASVLRAHIPDKNEVTSRRGRQIGSVDDRKRICYGLGSFDVDYLKSSDPTSGEFVYFDSLQFKRISYLVADMFGNHTQLQNAVESTEGSSIHQNENIEESGGKVKESAVVSGTTEPIATLPRDPRKLGRKLKIICGVPSTTQGTNIHEVKDLPFLTVFLPTFLTTIDANSPLFEYSVYLGYDPGDRIYDNEENQKTLLEAFDKLASKYPLELKLFKIEVEKGYTVALWNFLLKEAMENGGADYYYQLNDDIKFITAGWSERFVNSLRYNTVLQDFGMAGPLDKNQDRILTQAFCSRVHYEIFGWFYPPTFKNWYSDDWVTHVYGKENTFWYSDVTVVNTNIKGTRYKADYGAIKMLEEELLKRREHIRGTVKDKYNMDFSVAKGADRGIRRRLKSGAAFSWDKWIVEDCSF